MAELLNFLKIRLSSAAPASILLSFLIASCGSNEPDQAPLPISHTTPSSPTSDYGATASSGQDYKPVPAKPRKSPSTLYREANVKKDYIPRGRHARKYRRSMRPRYITIHSTQNFSRGADAWRHSSALKNGKLRARKRRGGNRIGYLVWHFTVDQYRAVQHLPTNEQGEHADFNGPGNNYSIGIEMCEHRGNSRRATIERTAKLTAYLMYKHKIPLRKVVPHYHWRRKGLSKPHKNCPHFLLDNGRPGAKWQWFLKKVNKHYKDITSKVPATQYTPQITPQPTPQPKPQQSISPSSYPPGVYPLRTASNPTPSRSNISITPIRNTPTQSTVRYHTVVRNDTLYSLARRYGTTVAAIKSANSMSSDTIGIGQRLRLP